MLYVHVSWEMIHIKNVFNTSLSMYCGNIVLKYCNLVAEKIFDCILYWYPLLRFIVK